MKKFHFRKWGFVIFLTGATKTDFFEIGWWNYMTIASKPHIPFLWGIFLRLDSSSSCCDGCLASFFCQRDNIMPDVYSILKEVWLWLHFDVIKVGKNVAILQSCNDGKIYAIPLEKALDSGKRFSIYCVMIARKGENTDCFS